jgi:hypothetical protein
MTAEIMDRPSLQEARPDRWSRYMIHVGLKSINSTGENPHRVPRSIWISGTTWNTCLFHVFKHYHGISISAFVSWITGSSHTVTVMAQSPSNLLAPHNPAHMLDYKVFIYERCSSDGSPMNPQHPYSYHLIREWNCDCPTGAFKNKAVHIIHLNSPLCFPDARIYSCLCHLEPANPVEPPHAQAYREKYGEAGMSLYTSYSGSAEFAGDTGTRDQFQVL